MRTTIVFIILLTISFQSCDENCTSDRYEYKLFENSQINHVVGAPMQSHLFNIEEGNKLVAQYMLDRAECKDIMDDEYTEYIAFEIPNSANITSFEWTDQELEEVNAYFYPTGAWWGGVYFPLEKGTIRGTKISANEWEISIDIESPATDWGNTFTVNTRGRFRN